MSNLLQEEKVEKNFLKYQIALLEWNDAVGEKNHLQKTLPDSFQNRNKLQRAHNKLKQRYSVMKQYKSDLDDAILERHHKTRNWERKN